ncbi:hypothetical protein ACQJBY_051075 [Aegilops geniculata]
MEGGDAPPGISMGRAMSSEGDLDLLEQLLSGDNAWLEVAPNTSRSPNFFASPSTFLSDATTTTTTPASTNNALWIQSGSSTVRQRLDQALAYIKEMQRDVGMLVQLWVPIKSGEGQLVLSTSGQPFTLDETSERLRQFREVSTRYQFSADVASESSPIGLPGRVFIGKLPEWSPDVRYFTSYEYPRVNHAQYLDVHGTMGLPVFEKGSYSCLGVMELIMTRQKLNFTSEINNICSALQAVNLRSTEVSSIPRATKFNSASYKDALPEILEVLRAACVTHKLPLAQTWVTCAQQGKRGSRHSDENYRHCISTIDAACYINDPQMQNFHESCSDHHLLHEEGVAGKAFTTNQPCFLPDIGSSTKMEYPLSHHAKIFNLKGAVAIRLRCTRTGTADFVLEFFLPTNCEALEEQKAVLDSLSGTMRSTCRTLRVVTDKEMGDEKMLEVNEMNSFGSQGKKVEELSFGDQATEHREEASWTSLAGTSKESDLAELSIHGMLSPVGQGLSPAGAQTSAQGSKGKRRTKTEKTVSLPVLRQYFAGSLKDAARSLGVCPTTLKRICRQHGINRWPSRKIKKVDHSLRKLQQIIDSVHGGETAFQLNTLYKDLTNTSVSSDNNLSGSVTVPPHKQSNLTDFEGHRHHRLSSNVPSTSHSHSSCSQSSDSSPSSCSGGSTKHPPQAGVDLLMSGNPVNHSPVQTLQTENASIRGHFPVQEAPDLLHNLNQKALGGQHSSRSPSPPIQNADAGMRIKATFGSEKVRFRLKPECSFQELKQEMARRLSIADTSFLIVKYLDDDLEWVLMTCDADLQECLHVYKLANLQTVKISVHLAPIPEARVTVGHTGLS